MNIESWMLTLILMLVIPFALATIGGIRGNGIGGVDVSIFLCSLTIMMVYLVYVGILPTFTIIFPIIVMGFMYFGGGGDSNE